MKAWKKVVATAVAALMVGTLAACGGGTKSTGETTAAAAAAEQTTAAAAAAAQTTAAAAAPAASGDIADKKIGISIYKFDDNFMTLYRNELERILVEDMGFKKENVVIQDGKGDQAEQTNQIKNFITQQYDVLILNLVQSSSASEITDICNDAGIPVVYINREPDAAEEARWTSENIKATYVGCDARQSGTYQGEEILETPNKGDINGDGVVSYIMVQGDPENVDAQYRTEFSIKALTDAGVQVKELLKQRGDWDQARGQQITQDALTQFGDQVEVVFCNNDAMALGALQAIESAGRKINQDIYLVGVDALTEAVQNVIADKQTGTVFNDHFSQAQSAADCAVAFLKGEPVQAVNMVNYLKVTKANAADILAQLAGPSAGAAAGAAAAAVGGADVSDKKVGISIYKFDDNFMTLYRNELERILVEDLGFKKENVVIQDGKGDQAEQTNQIKNFITQQYDVLILNLVQSSSASEITDICNAAGIPVVYINREPDAAEEARWTSENIKATYVGCDARQSGTYQGEEILETPNKGDINGDGVVSYIMVQGDPENVDAQYRTEFSIKALTDAGVQVKELLKQRGDWDQARGQQITQDALTQFGDQVEVVFCNNDAMALGALQAIESAGRKINEDIYLVGVDALTEAVQNVIEGKQTGTVFNDHFSQAQMAVDCAVAYLRGEPVQAVNMVDYLKVTKDNAQEILDQIK